MHFITLTKVSKIIICFRQTLTFVEIGKNPVDPIKADYMARGSLQYEFAAEILQTPIQLMKIRDAPAQVLLYQSPSQIIYSMLKTSNEISSYSLLDC